MGTKTLKQRGRPKVEKGRVQVTVSMSEELKKSVEFMAQTLGVSLSEFIRNNLYGYLETYDTETYWASQQQTKTTFGKRENYPTTWEEFHKRSVQNAYDSNLRIQAWATYLEQSDKARAYGMSWTEYYVRWGQLIPLDDLTPDERWSEWMANNPEKAEEAIIQRERLRAEKAKKNGD